MGAIKTKLIQEIEKIQDEVILKQITQLITESDQGLIAEFTSEQKNKIEESRKQIKEGDSFGHQDVMKSM
jgi:hypothetical protein